MATKIRKAKAPKDLNAPKKNLSGYFIFTQERRPALKAQHPDKKLTALTTIMAKEWKEMDDATKKGFQARSDADKATYQVKLAEYQKTENYTKFQSKLSVWKRESNLTAEKNAAKKPKDKNAPKQSPTGYFLFTAEIRASVTAANPTLKVTQLAKLFGEKWKALDDDKKKQYTDEAARLKIEHKTTVEEYQKSEQYAQYQAKVAAWEKEQAMKKEEERAAKQGPQAQDGTQRKKVSMPRKPKDANAPKKALSAFLLFSNSVRNQCRSENPELKITQISGVIGKKWKSLSVEDQKKWSELAAKNKAEYQIAIAKYKESEHFKAFEKTMADWKTECQRRQSKADALFVKKMEQLSTKAAAAKYASGKNAKKQKGKSSPKGKKQDQKKRRKYSYDSDSSSCSSSSSGSYSSSSSGSYSSSSSYSD